MINNQIGIIGVGYWGTNIVNVIVKLNIKKIYCYDKNKENLKEIKRKFPNIITYNSFKEFLNLNISGVIIAVNTNDHYEVAKKCLEKGFNIFVEKPVTSDSN